MANVANNQMCIVDGTQENIDRFLEDMAGIEDKHPSKEYKSDTLSIIATEVYPGAYLYGETIMFESPWSAPDGLIKALKKDYDLDVEIYTEELSSGIYQVETAEGLFFLTEGDIDSCYQKNEHGEILYDEGFDYDKADSLIRDKRRSVVLMK